MKNESIAISYCINIPEDATNGDVIKALFPKGEFDFNPDTVGLVFEKKGRISIYDVTFAKVWWDAPYTTES